MLDLQGQIVGAPVVDLLGGAVRDAVPYSAYLFFKYAEHIDKPYAARRLGRRHQPRADRRAGAAHDRALRLSSIKLKGGVFEPAHEIACMRALHQAFPGLPLRLDPNANWSLATSIAAAPELDELLEYYEDPTPGPCRAWPSWPGTPSCRWPPTWSSPRWRISAAAPRWAR